MIVQYPSYPPQAAIRWDQCLWTADHLYPIIALLGREDNDVVYDKEKDEASLRVAISDSRFGRAEDASSKDRLAQTKEKIKSSRETERDPGEIGGGFFNNTRGNQD